MNRKITWMIAAILLCGTVTASAQKAQNVSNGKVVKRITFDREKVNIVYTDNTQETDVEQATITRRAGEATGIASTTKANNARGWFTLDGRRLESAPSAKGVYVVKDGDKVRKTIKK